MVINMNLHDNLYRPALNYIKKERFTGSDTGMRFLFEKKKYEEDGREVITACVWPEPFAYDHTEEEKKEFQEFPLTEEGLNEAVAWIENRHIDYCKGFDNGY